MSIIGCKSVGCHFPKDANWQTLLAYDRRGEMATIPSAQK